MKRVNFLSKTSSQSYGHSMMTSGMTVGSPSLHRRYWMLRLMSVLVLIFTLGVGQMWATDVTYTFNSKSWGASEDNWTSGKDGYQMTSGRGIQVTTGASEANGTSPTSLSNVSQVVVTYSTNADNGAGSIAVQIGSNTASSQNVTKSGGTTDRTLTYNFSPNQTGNVKVTVTCTTNSIYVKSVKITYNTGGGGGGSTNPGLDILDRYLTGVTGTSYTDWTNSYSGTGHSSAAYKGNSAGGHSSIQLRATSPSGIITTATGGNATKVVVVWNDNTTSGRTIDIYGKNTAYSTAGDLYDKSTQGTKLGSIVYGTSTELDITGDYAFIGIRSNSQSLYLSSVSITWGYTVTYDGNGKTGGSVPTDATYYDKNATVTVKTNSGSLAKTGYDFGGWNTLANGNGTNYTAGSGTFGITASTTLYAKWNPKQYTITYKDQGNVNFSGTHASGYPTTHTYGTATTLKTATKTGYDFGGWYTTQACTGSAVTSLAATTYTANITLYAKWTPKQYTITYKDKNNADFSGTHASGYPTKHTYGTATTLSTATKTGYDFGGWFTAAACTGSAVTSLGATAYTASPTLYALWTPVTYTITYEGLSGASNSNPEEYTIETATITLADPGSRTGYTFAGWTCGGNPITQITLGSTGDKTITATWTPNQYSIIYKDQGNEDYSGSNGGSLPAKHTYGTQTNLVNGSKTGYTFSGWYANQNCTGDAVTSLAVDGYTDDITLYAKWTAKTYYVRFNKNNDDAEGTMSNQEFTYDVYQELSKNTFSLANKNFRGWATEEDGEMVHEDEAEVGNLTVTNNGIVDLYAVWVANTHTITYNGNGADGGTTPVDGTAHTHGSTVKTLLNTFTKTYYDWDSWNTQPDGQGASYDQNDDITVNDDITLYAIWNCIQEVNVSKGTPSHGTFTLDKEGYLQTCDGSVAVTVTPSPATGYQFSAVTATSGSVNNTTVTFAQYASGSSEINVTFVPKHITVTWDVNGGDDLAQSTSEYIYDGSTVSLPTPTRTGYDFDGWYTEAEGGDPIDNVGGANKPSADVEYYAHWNVKSYSVTWKISGTAWTTDGQSSVNHGSHVTTLPTAPDPGDYCGDKFMGWTDAANGAYVHGTSNLYTTASEFPNATGAQTFYAVFADYTK